MINCFWIATTTTNCRSYVDCRAKSSNLNYGLYYILGATYCRILQILVNKYIKKWRKKERTVVVDKNALQRMESLRRKCYLLPLLIEDSIDVSKFKRMFGNVQCVWGKKPDIGDSAIHESQLKRGKFLIALECLLSFETSRITLFLNNQMVSQTYRMTFSLWLKKWAQAIR